jgi:hypothetical protein
MRLPFKCWRNVLESLLRCCRSITKAICAQWSNSGETGVGESWFRPAEATAIPGQSANTCSAVGVRSRLAPHMNSTCVTGSASGLAALLARASWRLPAEGPSSWLYRKCRRLRGNSVECRGCTRPAPIAEEKSTKVQASLRCIHVSASRTEENTLTGSERFTATVSANAIRSPSAFESTYAIASNLPSVRRLPFDAI